MGLPSAPILGFFGGLSFFPPGVDAPSRIPLIGVPGIELDPSVTSPAEVPTVDGGSKGVEVVPDPEATGGGGGGRGTAGEEARELRVDLTRRIGVEMGWEGVGILITEIRGGGGGNDANDRGGGGAAAGGGGGGGGGAGAGEGGAALMAA